MSYELIQPRVFVGSAQWLSLHTYAVKYVPSAATKKAAKQYVEAIGVLFPCSECAEHFKEFCRKHDIENYLQNNHRFFLWTYLAHDNATRAKGEESPPYNETKRFYFESLLGSCDSCN